ncbi:hypothetical protein BD289DRAFT_428750 [Coniella lustricola]|uniref:Secreted protein n=1 Tax=Coniella lustricola TaxID=2025994 RepID=A0A2T3ADK3_9PEZI|nr:hypothetical protein BD289DRAFT_428750 [Coniella lustricola]
MSHTNSFALFVLMHSFFFSRSDDGVPAYATNTGALDRHTKVQQKTVRPGPFHWSLHVEYTYMIVERLIRFSLHRFCLLVGWQRLCLILATNE